MSLPAKVTWFGRLAVILGGLVVTLRPWAPWGALLGLVGALGTLARAYRGASGTALRPVVVWGIVAVGLGMVAQVVGLGEPWESGRPGAGHFVYLSALATVAALLTVFNARRPGGNAWAFLMAALVVVLLLPWIENGGLSGRAGPWERLRLEAPWSWFLLVLAVAGLSNFVPTRFAPATLPAALGLGFECWALTATDRVPALRGWAWAVGPWALAASLVVAEACAGRRPAARDGLERAWFWFRDHWGVVWGLRVAERFNESARALGWPVRLSWHGPEPADGVEPSPVPDGAEALFVSLLRRFADAGRVEAEAHPATERGSKPRGPSADGAGMAR